MSDNRTSLDLSRRRFLTGGAVLLAGAAITGGVISERAVASTVMPKAFVPAPVGKTKRLHLAGTDGWVAMPGNAPADPPFFPDSLAPDGLDTYVFGFRDVSGLSDSEVAGQRGKAQISAPMLSFDQEDDVYITLTNLGLALRPDLYDGHSLHWHGFVNAIPLFDGVPELSIAVPIGRDFTYFYRPHDAGTYMYHCHFEDVEHVQMGMTGMLFVRPSQNAGTTTVAPGKYAYNDGDGSTRYDREFGLMVTEIWSAAHYRDAHIQVNDWTDYEPSFSLLNGRAYPDTIAGNGSQARDGTLIAPNGNPQLQNQPITSLVTCNTGDKVLLRVSNLAYNNHSLTVDNIDLTIVAKDASLLKGRDGTKNYINTNTIDLGAGESRDVIFTAPEPGEYLLYDRRFSFLANGGGAGYGGMMTKIIVGPPGTYGPQLVANT
ncbi:MAG: Multicopper oxidase [Frankiales bacterium]|nr:Multicopper oxidase [Frankiales bacterium]